ADTETEAARTTVRIELCCRARTDRSVPPVSMVDPLMPEWTELNTLLTDTLTPTATAAPAAPAWTATAPPMAIAGMPEVPDASTVTVDCAPARYSFESSICADTILLMSLMATDTPTEAPTPAEPADTATPRAPATVTIEASFNA